MFFSRFSLENESIVDNDLVGCSKFSKNCSTYDKMLIDKYLQKHSFFVTFFN